MSNYIKQEFEFEKNTIHFVHMFTQCVLGIVKQNKQVNGKRSSKHCEDFFFVALYSLFNIVTLNTENLN